jgi:hypothetical protein
MASVYPFPPKTMSRQKTDVDQRHHPVLGHAIVVLVGVLQGKDIYIHQRRRLGKLGDDPGVVRDAVLLRGHQKDLHVVRILRQHDVVEVDLVDVERQVLLGFPVNRLRKLGLGHGGDLDLADRN